MMTKRDITFGTTMTIDLDWREGKIKDKLQAILQQESTKYFVKNDFQTSNYQVNEAWRRKICEWLFEIIDHLQFDREIALVSLCYFDRAVSAKARRIGKAIAEKEYQVLAITCFYIAMKLHGDMSQTTTSLRYRRLNIEAFVGISRGLLTKATLEEKELEILSMLSWHVNPSTTISIVAYLLCFLPNSLVSVDDFLNSKVMIYEISRYLAELAACVSSIAFNYRPSDIAYACVLCAFDAIDTNTDIFIPLYIEVDFVNKIFASIFLTPQSVESLKSLLKDVCPSMFCEDGNHAIFPPGARKCINKRSCSEDVPEDDGNKSPVCVKKFIP